MGVSTERGAIPVFFEANSTPRGVAVFRREDWKGLIAVDELGEITLRGEELYEGF